MDSYVDGTIKSRLEKPRYTQATMIVDIDEDGWLDLFVGGSVPTLGGSDAVESSPDAHPKAHKHTNNTGNNLKFTTFSSYPTSAGRSQQSI